MRATGVDLSYRWQYRSADGRSWKNTTATGSRTTTVRIPATASRNGYQYRCKITDVNGKSVFTKVATLKVSSVVVTAQPSDNYLMAGKTAEFTVVVEGEGLKYQWQYWDPGYDVWGNTTATGSKTATLKVPATLGRNGYRYRCKITDSYGNVIYSKVVALKVK